MSWVEVAYVGLERAQRGVAPPAAKTWSQHRSFPNQLVCPSTSRKQGSALSSVSKQIGAQRSAAESLSMATVWRRAAPRARRDYCTAPALQ